MPSSTFRQLVLLAVCATGMSQVHAATILSIDFDTASGNFQYGYAYAGYGDPTFTNFDISGSTSQVTAIIPGIGLGGSSALRITADGSAAGALLPSDRTYDYFGFALAENAPLSGLPSDDLGDYTFGISSVVSGLQIGATGATGRLDLHIYAPDGTLGPVNGAKDELIFLRYGSGMVFDTTFQTATLNLGDAAIQGGSVGNFVNFFAAANELEVVIETNEGNGKFGFDAGNVLTVDNITLDVVPEPTLALNLALGALFLARRRRNS